MDDEINSYIKILQERKNKSSLNYHTYVFYSSIVILLGLVIWSLIHTYMHDAVKPKEGWRTEDIADYAITDIKLTPQKYYEITPNESILQSEYTNGVEAVGTAITKEMSGGIILLKPVKNSCVYLPKAERGMEYTIILTEDADFASDEFLLILGGPDMSYPSSQLIYGLQTANSTIQVYSLSYAIEQYNLGNYAFTFITMNSNYGPGRKGNTISIKCHIDGYWYAERIMSNSSQ